MNNVSALLQTNHLTNNQNSGTFAEVTQAAAATALIDNVQVNMEISVDAFEVTAAAAVGKGACA